MVNKADNNKARLNRHRRVDVYKRQIMVGYEKDTRRLFYARGENFVTEGFAKASSCIENYFVYQDSIHVVPQEKEKT